MLLKKTSNSLSLSKSAAITVRTGDGMENFWDAMSWEKKQTRQYISEKHTYYYTHVQKPTHAGIFFCEGKNTWNTVFEADLQQIQQQLTLFLIIIMNYDSYHRTDSFIVWEIIITIAMFRHIIYT